MVSKTSEAERRSHFPEAWLARGYFDHLDYVFKFGFNGEVGTTEESIWDQGDVYSYPASASQLTLSSDDVNDTSAGTGARTVSIQGLDANYEEQTETITLNGQTEVTSVGSYIRIFRMSVLTGGSGGTNAGTIYAGTGTVTGGVPANIFAIMSPGEAQTLMAIYTVPANKTAQLYSFGVSSFGNANAVATARLIVRNDGGVFRTQDKVLITRGTLIIPHRFPVPIPEKSDIEVTAVASTGTIDVSAAFEIMLVDNGA